ncbi:DegT/DnrJ/EryC1/StrS family aminotransferase [Xanthomarina sp. F1114]|uniref:DegT/DnrJ/EryC1/StrS family aminotransferase n=1 Tax=Xanthomarina sp. F1114 TaxID=2996019 RepID=UPI00225E1593|nr:DegT/DnrJ/EryC1/StrS family aminotransferase [Xanthomarina sp. F1114]MCX7548185.1 DegT/DnrJ/EryC1/StrS family aminotransferase [Xanthomarina sp. F1114]
MIKFLDLYKINKRFEPEFQKKFQQFLDSGHYVLGKEVKAFETNFAAYCGTKYCIGTSNGLDALTLIFKAYLCLGNLKPGDHVLIPANTFFASVLSVVNSGLVPVFIEPEEETFNISIQEIEKHINPKVKAIMAVHLYGQLANIGAINTIAEKHNLLVIEDAAQAHGAETETRIKAGNLSHAAAFSFYPSKNLGALGDGGAITTNNAALAEVLKKMHNYGTERKYEFDLIGYNHRLDEIQAVFLNMKLAHLDSDNLKRQEIANRYLSEISSKKVELPFYDGSKNHVFHLFVVRVKNRDKFVSYLKNHDIETLIHYPIPPHKQKALINFSHLNLPITEQIHKTVVSLPISPVMSNQEIAQVVKIINSY